MRTSKIATAGVYRGQSSPATSHRLFGGVAAACLAVGCGWTVYTNILAANVYPTLGTSGYDEPIVRLPRKLVTRNATEAVSEAFALLGRPESVAALSPDMFNERFAAAEPQSVASNAASDAPPPAPAKLAETPKPKDGPAAKAQTPTPAPAQVALNVAAPASRPAEVKPARSASTSLRDMTQRAKAAVMSIASNEKQTIYEKLWGKQAPSPHFSLLSFASADANITGSIPQNVAQEGSAPRYERDTAVYDISAHMVYLPDGTSLEAHSGLGSKLDDPSSAPIKMHGVTPPHMYELSPREALFHGVPALRLNPIGGEETIYGRAGLLAHTYMLGPNGDSNGCVSFKDYNAFLNAYRNQGIRKLAVVAKVD
jgi:outer membrane biosynthesis protein TonB